MKIEVEFYSDELKDVKAEEAFEIYENLYYIEQEKFINSFLKNSDKIEILEKILEISTTSEIESIKKFIKDK